MVVQNSHTNLMPSLYLPRTLMADTKRYSELDLLSESPYVIVLAEPGGGKSELLKSLASQLGTSRINANVYAYKGISASHSVVVIDALDELVKVGDSEVLKLLGKASESGADKIILSSRSSEWNDAWTRSFESFIGQKPLVVRLLEFNDAEQQSIFECHTDGLCFEDFRQEVSRFELDSLLPNPQFLKLFADAYVESDKNFKNKQSIFQLAVERLAKETNEEVQDQRKIPTKKKVQLASEIFAKLLLSGSIGVSSREVSADRLHPMISSLCDGEGLSSVLGTRLFKPSDNTDKHQPVHKIVAEYCAANYIVERIKNSNDPLRLSGCLSVIAPNSAVRDELRGMLGWMAALGNQPIQEAAIALDPYAVLANGDPSQLSPSAKLKLIHGLKELSISDPWFRRRDFGRKFSAAGFFTQDIIDEVKGVLTGDSVYGHLRNLVLELLLGSIGVPQLTEELSNLLHSADAGYYPREMASRCLRKIEDYNCSDSLSRLIEESSKDSLQIAVSIAGENGCEKIDREILFDILQACANIFSKKSEPFENVFGSFQFVRVFVDKFDLETTTWILSELTKSIKCSCGVKYDCHCRFGVSKISGLLLDQYFRSKGNDHNPEQIWGWVRDLYFPVHMDEKDSDSVRFLKLHDSLRRSIFRVAFDSEQGPNKQLDLKQRFFGFWHAHSGLIFLDGDHKFIVDHAFDQNDVALWELFLLPHNFYKREPDYQRSELRRHMRTHALSNDLFMLPWSKINHYERVQRFEQDLKYGKRMRRLQARNKKRRQKVIERNTAFVHANRALIESGKHWNTLRRFAELVLFRPEDVEEKLGDKTIVKNALSNCLGYIEPHVPNLEELAELHCSSRIVDTERVLLAACVEIFRKEKGLSSVSTNLLLVLRTKLDSHYPGYADNELVELQAETSKLIFTTDKEVKEYIDRYIEPQLKSAECKHPKIDVFRNDSTFFPFRKEVPIRLLGQYPSVSLYALDELFELSAEFGDQATLRRIIVERCDECLFEYKGLENEINLDDISKFWLVRAFVYLDDLSPHYWDALAADKSSLLSLSDYTRPFGRSDRSYQPILSPKKIAAILDAFFDLWPKVDLPDHWGTESPSGEKAYRFLKEIIWSIESDEVDDSLGVLDRLLDDIRFVDMHQNMKSMKAALVKKKMLVGFKAPEPEDIVSLLDKCEVVTVEGLRALLLEELDIYQADLNGSDTATRRVFYKDYSTGDRLGEVEATFRIVERMKLRLENQAITVRPEQQMHDNKRCDFTCSKVISNRQRLLVIEVKGQWHEDLYTAAEKQLYERYSSHPDAEQQGIYLVLWFGPDEKIANKKKHELVSARQLKQDLEQTIPETLRGQLDVFVLDVSRG